MKTSLSLVPAVHDTNSRRLTGLQSPSRDLPQTRTEGLSPVEVKRNKSRLNCNLPRTRLKGTSSASVFSVDRIDSERASVFLLCSRLIDSIRENDGQQGAGVLSQAWDLSVNDEEDWRDELREASGVGRRKKKRVRISSSPHRSDMGS